jgi:hypothetical protein
MPGQPGPLREMPRHRGLAGSGYAVDKDPVSHAAMLLTARAE